MRWEIDRQVVAAPEPGRHTERAIALHLMSVRNERHVTTVEYDHGAPTIAAGRAMRPYLKAGRPPRRLRVRRDGQISVLED